MKTIDALEIGLGQFLELLESHEVSGVREADEADNFVGLGVVFEFEDLDLILEEALQILFSVAVGNLW